MVIIERKKEGRYRKEGNHYRALEPNTLLLVPDREKSIKAAQARGVKIEGANRKNKVGKKKKKKVKEERKVRVVLS